MEIFRNLLLFPDAMQDITKGLNGEGLRENGPVQEALEWGNRCTGIILLSPPGGSVSNDTMNRHDWRLPGCNG